MVIAEAASSALPAATPVAVSPGPVAGPRQAVNAADRPHRSAGAATVAVRDAPTVEAVRREVLEEAGARVGAVRYHSSQPWPFPSSLMIGCHADALTTDLRPDDVEMQAVQWFERATVQRALAGEDGELRVPASFAIAHHLIRAWAEGSA